MGKDDVDGLGGIFMQTAGRKSAVQAIMGRDASVWNSYTGKFDGHGPVLDAALYLRDRGQTATEFKVENIDGGSLIIKGNKDTVNVSSVWKEQGFDPKTVTAHDQYRGYQLNLGKPETGGQEVKWSTEQMSKEEAFGFQGMLKDIDASQARLTVFEKATGAPIGIIGKEGSIETFIQTSNSRQKVSVDAERPFLLNEQPQDKILSSLLRNTSQALSLKLDGIDTQSSAAGFLLDGVSLLPTVTTEERQGDVITTSVEKGLDRLDQKLDIAAKTLTITDRTGGQFREEVATYSDLDGSGLDYDLEKNKNYITSRQTTDHLAGLTSFIRYEDNKLVRYEDKKVVENRVRDFVNGVTFDYMTNAAVFDVGTKYNAQIKLPEGGRGTFNVDSDNKLVIQLNEGTRVELAKGAKYGKNATLIENSKGTFKADGTIALDAGVKLKFDESSSFGDKYTLPKGGIGTVTKEGGIQLDPGTRIKSADGKKTFIAALSGRLYETGETVRQSQIDIVRANWNDSKFWAMFGVTTQPKTWDDVPKSLKDGVAGPDFEKALKYHNKKVAEINDQQIKTTIAGSGLTRSEIKSQGNQLLTLEGGVILRQEGTKANPRYFRIQNGQKGEEYFRSGKGFISASQLYVQVQEIHRVYGQDKEVMKTLYTGGVNPKTGKGVWTKESLEKTQDLLNYRMAVQIHKNFGSDKEVMAVLYEGGKINPKTGKGVWTEASLRKAQSLITERTVKEIEVSNRDNKKVLNTLYTTNEKGNKVWTQDSLNKTIDLLNKNAAASGNQQGIMQQMPTAARWTLRIATLFMLDLYLLGTQKALVPGVQMAGKNLEDGNYLKGFLQLNAVVLGTTLATTGASYLNGRILTSAVAPKIGAGEAVATGGKFAEFLNPANSTIINAIKSPALLAAANSSPKLVGAAATALIGGAGGGLSYTAYVGTSDTETFNFANLGKWMFTGASIASMPYTISYLFSPSVANNSFRNIITNTVATSAVGTTLTNTGSILLNGKPLTLSQDVNVAVSFMLPGIGAVMSKGASAVVNTYMIADKASKMNAVVKVFSAAAQIPSLPVTQFWANTGLALGHVGSVGATGRPMSMEQSMVNVGTTYVSQGIFQGVGAGINIAGKTIANYGRSTPFINSLINYAGKATPYVNGAFQAAGKGISPSSKAIYATYPAIGALAGLGYNRVETGEWFNGSTAKNMGIGAGVGLGAAASARLIYGAGEKLYASATYQEGKTIFTEKAGQVKTKVSELSKSPFFKAVNDGIKIAYEKTATPLRNMGSKFSEMTGFKTARVQFLAGSTSSAYIESQAPLVDSIGAGSGPVGALLLDPGRTMLATFGKLGEKFGFDNDLANQMALIKAKERVTFDNAMYNNFGDYGSIFPSLAVSGLSGYLQFRSGAYSFSAASSPVQAVRETLALGSIAKDIINQINSGEPMEATGAQWGRLAGGLLGVYFGGKHLARDIAFATNAPVKVAYAAGDTRIMQMADGGYKMLRDVSTFEKFGYFAAKAHDSAASLMNWNTGIAVAMPTLGKKDQIKAYKQSVYAAAYSMDTLATSSIAAAAVFTGLGEGFGRIANSKVVRGFAESNALQKAIEHPMLTSTSLAVPGATMYYAGTEGKIPFTDIEVFHRNPETKRVDSVAANYVANAGLIMVGGAGLFASKAMKSSTQVQWTESALNTTVGTGAQGWKAFGYASSYALAGGLGSTIAAYGTGERDITNLATYFGLGAAAGLGLRYSPKVVMFATDLASISAITYGTKKAVFDPAVSRIEKWLDPRNHFDMAEASAPHLFDSHPVKGYVLGANGEKLIDPKTGEYRWEQQKEIDLFTGKVVSEKWETTDWRSALLEGAMVWGITRSAKASVDAYKKGLPEETRGAWQGTWDGMKEYATTRSKSGALASWYDFGAKNPIASSVAIGATGAGLYALGEYSTLKDTDAGQALRYSGYSLMGLGAAIAATRIAGSFNSRVLD
ncbi:MAG TPA: hypothetical protein PLU24_00700, partial [Candidatus Omnitrophota bacterium]|nr:hypothetical protein [Candidatus Omnitrophota bacterium]